MKINKKGITLLALVVTVIALLILAGVSVATILKDDSIIKKAQEAKRNNVLSQEKEGVSLAVITAKTISKSENVEFNKFLLQEEVDNQFGKGVAIVGDRRPDNTFIITIENREYTVYDDKIESFELPKVIDPKPGELEKESEEIFLINSIEDLIEFSKMVESDNTFAGKTVKLVNTLDFNSDYSYVDPNNKETYGDYNGDGNIEEIKKELTTGSGFKPIGNGKLFSGTFEGNNKQVRNLYLIADVQHNAGFFTSVYKGTVKNLTISGNVETSNTATKCYSFGGMIGYTTDSHLKNLVNNCTVISNGPVTECVGGITGFNRNSIIEDCFNNGNVTVQNTTGEIGLGGIAGFHYDYGGMIINSCNTGNISGYNGGRLTMGGIVGQRESGRVMNCINLGNVYAEINQDTARKIEVGGICGYVHFGANINCINIGDVTCKGLNTTKDIQLGGILGNGYSTRLWNCYNAGKILGEINENKANVGGVIGFNYYNTSENLFNVGEVKTTAKCDSLGGITGRSYGDPITFALTKKGCCVGKAINGTETETIKEKENLNVQEVEKYMNDYLEKYKLDKRDDYQMLKKFVIIDGQLVHEK